MDLKARQYSAPTPQYAPISSPDFEDEITLLSARPVVPLADIETRSSSRRWVPAALAFFLGILAIGTVVQLRRNRNDSQMVLNSSTDSSMALPERKPEKSAAQPLPASSTNNAQQANQSDNSPIADQAQSESSLLGVAGRSKAAASPFLAAKIRENNLRNGFDIKARRQLRREARRAERAGEKDTTDSRDGIFRIKDIFEGSGRP